MIKKSVVPLASALSVRVQQLVSEEGLRGNWTPFFSPLGSNLLESKADGIEVSYNACGVLSHIMFDGPEAWGICEPQREEVEERMWAAIQSWDINSRRNINYRCAVGRVGRC